MYGGSGMAQVYPLKEYYVRYLREIKGLKNSSVNHYVDAINFISKYLCELQVISYSLFCLNDVEALNKYRLMLKADEKFVQIDERGHRMYSAGLNNYYKFACGDFFEHDIQSIKALDIKLPPAERQTETVVKYTRDSIIKKQVLRYAKYKCEIDGSHSTFTAKSNNEPYMEGHHAIPMKEQGVFENSLDVYANVVCLCPICHRLMHYGIDSEKKLLIDKIYYDRSERLANSGIILSYDEFYQLSK